MIKFWVKKKSNQQGYGQNHHGNYAAHGYPPQETKDKKKKKGLLGQAEDLLSGVMGGGSNGYHGSQHAYQQQVTLSEWKYQFNPCVII